ncbi:hypothetical protein MKX03_020691 [Papaver bracteatum]|nr:hypothetical protein MKX03_020691 [Papaver bracteatum]
MQRPGSATQMPPNKVRWGLEEDENCHKENFEPKFGDAVHKGVGTSARLTMVSTEDKRPQPPGSKDDTKVPGDSLSNLGGAALMVCRICGKKGDHWTGWCPKKRLALPPPDLANHFGTSKSATDIPPGKRDGVKRLGSEMKPRRNEGNSVRVSNLPKYTSEPDLLELFSDFGHVEHVSVSVDQKTGIVGGLVIFAKKEDADRAICDLSAWGYDRIFE